MSTSKDQVLELISSGKISVAEGEQLLSAMKTPRRSWWQLLVNPFEKLNVGPALVFGAIGAVLAMMLSRWNVRFDGAVDVHLSQQVVSWTQSFVDQLVSWPLAATSLWAIGFLFARQGRLVDFLGYVGTARLPLLLVGLLSGAMRHQVPANIDARSPLPVTLLVVAFATLPAVIWSVTMLFQGYKTASGLRGVKCGVSFTAAILITELLSKLALHLMALCVS